MTKYALTKGPYAVEAELRNNTAYWKCESYSYIAFKNDYFFTAEEALADCERRRKAKLASLEKQRKKLETMTFEIKE